MMIKLVFAKTFYIEFSIILNKKAVSFVVFEIKINSL